MKKKVDEFHCENVILCGDFNLVLDPKLDYKHHSNLKRNQNAREAVSKLMEKSKLVDIFRKMNPLDEVFIHQTAKPPRSARLDFFLISENLQSNCLPEIHCIASGIIKRGKVDHSIITLSFLNEEDLWEFDISFLLNQDFVKSINEVVLSYKNDGDLEGLLREIQSIQFKQRRGVGEGKLRGIMSGIIPRIKLENDFIYEQSVILEKTKEYYEGLYRNVGNSAEDEDNLKKYFSFPNERKLSNEDKSSLDAYGSITLEEGKETLDRMKSDDLPSSDGFTMNLF